MSNDTKNGVTWSNTAKGRFIKQHGDVYKIPAGDAHEVKTYEDPTHINLPSPEEIKTATDSLEEKIEQLKGQGKQPVTPQPKGNNFYDEWID